MKILLVIFYLTLAVPSLCQEIPVHWTADIVREYHSRYIIHLNGIIKKDWYVYAGDANPLGITPTEISWNNANMVATGELQNQGTSVVITDKSIHCRLHVYNGNIKLEQKISIRGDIPATFRIRISGFASDGKLFLPFETIKEISIKDGVTSNSNSEIKIATIDVNKPLNDCGAEQNADSGVMAIFLLGFAGGLIVLFTPCVFPMIPLTISYFAKNKSDATHEKVAKLVKIDTLKSNGHAKMANRTGLVYGGFIVLFYLLASIPFHLLGNIDPAIFNRISTSVWINVCFFIVFVLFSLSLFGLFEIKLPGNLSSVTGTKGGIRALSGIFFMALTLAIVSFSCTGPILGTLLVGSLTANSGAWELTAGMTGFGLALGLPFALFAMFPTWLKHVPKSGSWLNTVKKILGFLELALAFKFLSNADLVAHWGILKREVFLSVWIIIFTGLALYLLHFFSQSGIKISRLRIGAGTLVGLFVAYLFAGLTNSSYANLTLLSGFPPPLTYSVYTKEKFPKTSVEAAVVNDYGRALLLAKKEKKPLLIDFTGWACVNCRKMEENVWSKPEVVSLINDNFIVVSLYVDDKQKLPASFVYRNGNEENEITTIGEKWAAFEAANFRQVTQPLYAIVNENEMLMNKPVGYTPDAGEYIEWLQCALNQEGK